MILICSHDFLKKLTYEKWYKIDEINVQIFLMQKIEMNIFINRFNLNLVYNEIKMIEQII